MLKCKIKGCKRPAAAKKLCKSHYYQNYRKIPKNRKKANLAGREYYKTREGSAYHKKYSFNYAREVKAKVVNHYCKGRPRCMCPGCTANGSKFYKFLTIDHLNAKGNLHKGSGKYRLGGHGLGLWIINNNFPKDFQILCSACNSSKHDRKTCSLAGKRH